MVAWATIQVIRSDCAVGVLSARASVVAISVSAMFAGVGASLPHALKREVEYKAHDQQHVVQMGKAARKRHAAPRRV